MARTVLPVVKAARGGVTSPTEQAGDNTNGHVVTNSGRTVITVRNADGTNPHQVTFETPGTVDGLAVSDRQVSVPANSSMDFGDFPASVYGNSLAIDVDSSQLKLVAREP
ncbi:hypothetical protein NE236_41335 [Actinoallomurus purpureus]|uniref:hypothetical protein n=1 Tax=Actinoallomurus purpureus TaxID=478114 RepID=UPI00209384CD|nr:hypothetical protein [Actinoallomurus purpureus]MCO6011413.1 hypothetical protein [Actinoallomurus purpureus]